jgi:hypothetical protein
MRSNAVGLQDSSACWASAAPLTLVEALLLVLLSVLLLLLLLVVVTGGLLVTVLLLVVAEVSGSLVETTDAAMCRRCFRAEVCVCSGLASSVITL